MALAAITYFAAYRDLLNLRSAAEARSASLVHRGIPAVQAERLGAAATAVAPLFALVLIHAFVISSMVGRITAASVVVIGFLVVSYLAALPWLIARKETPLWERWTMLVGYLAVGIGYVFYVTGFGQFDEQMLLLVLLLPTSSLVIGWWWLAEPSRTFAVRVWALITLFFSSGLYGSVIYGHVPLKYGGGRSETVRLVMKAPSEPLGALLDMQDGISAPLELVAQTTVEYVFVAPVSGTRSVIRINRAEVLGLVRQDDSRT